MNIKVPNNMKSPTVIIVGQCSTVEQHSKENVLEEGFDKRYMNLMEEIMERIDSLENWVKNNSSSENSELLKAFGESLKTIERRMGKMMIPHGG